MIERRIVLKLTDEEVKSLDATLMELMRSWTVASPSLLSKLRAAVVHAKHTIKSTTRKNNGSDHA